jgi:AraC-like DNA-binding protein
MDDSRGILRPEEARRHFNLTRVPPSADLAHLVDRHWMVEWDLAEPFTQEIVTHPSVNIAFQDPPTIHGVFTGRFKQELTGSGRVIATKFRPGGFHAFHPVPARTLTDRVIGADDVFPGLRPTTFAEIEEGLRAHGFTDDPRIDEVIALHAAMLDDPAITRVEHLCAHAGYSPRTLQRLFREYVGVTPKWVLDRIRLHEAAERMAEGEADWAGMALDLGYFDQAHFIKAFKAVVGRSPAAYALSAAATVGNVG